MILHDAINSSLVCSWEAWRFFSEWAAWHLLSALQGLRNSSPYHEDHFWHDATLLPPVEADNCHVIYHSCSRLRLRPHFSGAFCVEHYSVTSRSETEHLMSMYAMPCRLG